MHHTPLAWDDRYLINKHAENFMKPGLNLPSLDANATLTRLQIREDAAGGSTSILLHLTFPQASHTDRGAPQAADMLLVVPHSTSGPATTATTVATEISLTLQWYNKTATHAPETIWLSSVPVAPTRDAWTMDKMGSRVNPLDANLTGTGSCPNGITCGVHLHAVGDGGIQYSGAEAPGPLTLRSLDSALVSIGAPLAAPAPLVAPDPTLGVHFSLVNNVWNTNYPLWYPFAEGDQSSRFRFTIAIP